MQQGMHAARGHGRRAGAVRGGALLLQRPRRLGEPRVRRARRTSGTRRSGAATATPASSRSSTSRTARSPAASPSSAPRTWATRASCWRRGSTCRRRQRRARRRGQRPRVALTSARLAGRGRHCRRLFGARTLGAGVLATRASLDRNSGFESLDPQPQPVSLRLSAVLTRRAIEKRLLPCPGRRDLLPSAAMRPGLLVPALALCSARHCPLGVRRRQLARGADRRSRPSTTTGSLYQGRFHRRGRRACEEANAAI